MAVTERATVPKSRCLIPFYWVTTACILPLLINPTPSDRQADRDAAKKAREAAKKSE